MNISGFLFVSVGIEEPRKEDYLIVLELKLGNENEKSMLLKIGKEF
ncbi:hypothetical protein [Chryseobacterium sp. CH1]|nr:hypothetical protein [Chryseobacterium sp. CH1]